jgi:transcription-repair coupling factor (superfamily II helicase)
LADLAEGKVDIAIGTHRLFSQDVEFRDLGLVIVDEEQRFGVKHKERLKQFKKQVDVLP